MHHNDRVSFGSRLGAILAAAGSAVGLGNIWRFPYETGNHGGAVFYFDILRMHFYFRSSDYDCRVYYWTAFEGEYRRGF